MDDINFVKNYLAYNKSGPKKNLNYSQQKLKSAIICFKYVMQEKKLQHNFNSRVLSASFVKP